jgi:hypothetical protein
MTPECATGILGSGTAGDLAQLLASLDRNGQFYGFFILPGLYTYRLLMLFSPIDPFWHQRQDFGRHWADAQG